MLVDTVLAAKCCCCKKGLSAPTADDPGEFHSCGNFKFVPTYRMRANGNYVEDGLAVRCLSCGHMQGETGACLSCGKTLNAGAHLHCRVCGNCLNSGRCTCW